MRRLVLIDGNAILHRAYHALPLMSNDKGEPTNAVYGFVSMLLRVISDIKPTHLAIAFDRPKPTFRKKMFKGYQAQRPEMEEELVSQVDWVHKVVEAMQIPIFEKDGYEADDVIATLASQASSGKDNFLRHADPETSSGLSASKALKACPELVSGIPKSMPSGRITLRRSQVRDDKIRINEVIVVTGDRDLLQLVDDNIKLYMPVKGLSESKLYGEKEAQERMGVKPGQIPDLKALMGDASDNYPGVAGIGPKTAVNLLKQFGSLENIYKHLNELSNRAVAEKLKQDKDNALLSQRLAHVVKDVPIKLDQHKAKLHDLLTKEVVDVFGELGFKTLLKRISEMSKKETPILEKSLVQSKKAEEQMGMF